MRQISVNDICEDTVGQLGFDQKGLDILSTEVIANLLRRVASFKCPCTSSALVSSVMAAIDCLVKDDTLKEKIEDVLEAIVSYGDLLELKNITTLDNDMKGTWLYLAPPAFVKRQSGQLIIIGIATDNVTPWPDGLPAVEYRRHIRQIKPEDVKNDCIMLSQHGFISLSEQVWLKSPKKEKPNEYIRKLDSMLENSQDPGVLTGLSILDPSRKPTYYKGRWVETKNQTGHFIARRAQAYGANLWCYVKLEDGRPTKLLDFPISKNKYRGCDEAWHLQMAIDSTSGHPQQFRIRPISTKEGHIIDFFSPVPMWAQRRFDYIGEPATKHQCLCSYKFEDRELSQEIRFMKEELWLSEFSG